MLIEIKEAPKTIFGSSDVAEIFRRILSLNDEVDQDKEHLWVMGLNAAHIVLYIDLVTLGTLDSSIMHPREVFRTAIFKAAAKIIICHNHPSGSLNISTEDHNATYKLWQAGDILSIPLIDHVVIANGNTGHYSFETRGDLTKYTQKKVA
jgi:DNA repair protein RadC